MMRDKLINHAVRQAFEGRIGTDLYPAYVLYLTLAPTQVDVNVHPAKHEVRFHQARLVHDFIYRALTDSLNQYFQQGQQQQNSEAQVLPQVQPNHDYIQPLQKPVSEPGVDEVLSSYSGTAAGHPPVSSRGLAKKGTAQHLVNSSQVIINQSSKNYQQLMSASQPVNSDATSTVQTAMMPGQWIQVTDKKILVTIKQKQAEQKFYLLETKALHLFVMSKIYSDTMPVSQPLLMPISIAATAELLVQAKALYQPLLDNSVEIGWTPNRIILRKVPAGLRQFRWVECLEEILSCIETRAEEVRNHLLTCMVENEEIGFTQIQEIWQQFAHLSVNLEHDIARIGKLAQLHDWLNTYE
jgi:DNA mismatch repair protein MutL